MLDELKPRIHNAFLEITYLCVEIRPWGAAANGSGSTRLYLSELPKWLAERPGTLIVSLREI
jgi:hypothetical protein